MALPWLESLAGFGSTERDGRRRARQGRRRRAEALRRRLPGQRHQPESLVGQGQRRGDGAEPDAASRSSRSRRRSTSSTACSTSPRPGNGIHPGMTGNLLTGRAAQARRHHPQRHQHGPGAGQPHRPGHRAVEHGARLRGADDRLPRDQLLERLRLAHLVAERRLADAERDVSLAGVRQPVREPRQPAQRQRPRSREGARRDAAPPDQRRPTRPSSTST